MEEQSAPIESAKLIFMFKSYKSYQNSPYNTLPYAHNLSFI